MGQVAAWVEYNPRDRKELSTRNRRTVPKGTDPPGINKSPLANTIGDTCAIAIASKYDGKWR